MTDVTPGSAEKRWFVYYTKSRHEKKVLDLLERRGYEVFLPIHAVVRQWSDRKKKVEVPLFNSYIFVFSYEHEIPTVLTTPGISWSVRYNGKPAVLRQNEMELIQRFVSTGLFVETELIPSQFDPGDKVVVRDGPLKGVTGILEKTVAEARFIVAIESIQQVIKVQLPGYLLEKI